VSLGASNLTLGLSTLCSVACATLATPVDFFVAAGRGRSYGQTSRMLGRELPSVLDCGLWSALERSGATSIHALVTDLGNDLVYGSSPAQVQEWLERVLDRLAERRATVVVTGLPLESIERLPAWEFALVARVLFPLRDTGRGRLLHAARDLDGRIAEVCRARGIAHERPQLEWFGHDPIHVRSGHREAAWRQFLSAWRTSAGSVTESGVIRARGRFWYERVRVLGVECGVSQPCTMFADGGALRLY